MDACLFLFVVVLGGMLLGAIPLLMAVERRSKVAEQKRGAYAPASRRRDLVPFCLFPLVVYIFLWSSVAASFSWSGFLVGAVLVVIATTMVLYMGRAGSEKDRGCGAS